MIELVGNMHMHTPYSDGAKWHADIAADAISAGLDFIIVTDHNVWVDGIEGYYENELGRVLLLVGEEIHDMRRNPQANHFLAYGAEKELSPYARDPQKLINKTVESGGYGFLAHPFDPAAPNIGEDSLGWFDWDVEGFTGLEIWNFMSNFKGHLGGRLRSLRAAYGPEKTIIGPEKKTLQKWDELLASGKRVAAVGSSDAHGLTYKMGPLSRTIFPYEFLFRAVNTHILIKEELRGDLSHDKDLILSALGKGNGWVAYDLPGSTSGFRFSGQGKDKGIMGDLIKFEAGATLQVLAPSQCRIVMIRNGEIVAAVENQLNLTHLPIEPGAYRAECYIDHLGQERTWILSNPIYIERVRTGSLG
jgi:hypothetical protein